VQLLQKAQLQSDRQDGCKDETHGECKQPQRPNRNVIQEEVLMVNNIITGDPNVQNYLKQQFIRNRFQTPFVTDIRMSKAEAHARAWAAMRARTGR